MGSPCESVAATVATVAPVAALPGIRNMLAADFAEALRAGAQGMVDDLAANHGRPWGFPLDEIDTRVLLWYCELDRSVPPAMGEYIARMIPGCELTLVADAGHLWILVHLRDVLEAVTGASACRATQRAAM